MFYICEVLALFSVIQSDRNVKMRLESFPVKNVLV